MAMNSAQDAFQVALSRFQKQLTAKEQQLFKATTFNDLRGAIYKIQETQEASKELKALRRIEGFLEAMTQFGKVIEVFLNASDFLCFVWGPIKLILQVSRLHASSQGQI